MGTLFRIALYASGDSAANAAAAKAFQRVEDLNNILSDYKEDSELNRVSDRSGDSGWTTVSPPLFRVITKALEVAKKTDGAFDITVGPYVRLWRRMNREPEPQLPPKKILDKLSQSIGYQNIRIDSIRKAVALLKPGMQLDLGGIAKGYAADEALKVLQDYGIRSALVDAGGDIVVGDAPPGKKGWRVAIRSYNKKGKARTHILLLANRAVATSGDLFRYVEIDGKRYSHIINPKTGLGLTGQSMVTVIAADGITADSYASAVSVLGPESGLRLLEENPDLSGSIGFRENGETKRVASSDYEKFIDE